jgi:hypothetical protein
MRAKNAGLTLGLIAAGTLLVAVARVGEGAAQQAGRKADAEMSVPTTPDEHLARAATYQEKAAAYRKEAAEHRKMFADYERQSGNAALQSKSGRELPWVAKMRKHCEGYIKDAEKLAADAESFAAFHRMRAEEMRGR